MTIKTNVISTVMATSVYDNPCYTPIAIVQERRMAEPLPWDEVNHHYTIRYYAYCSLILMTILEMMAAKPPVVIPDEKMFLIASGNCIRMSG